MIDWYRVGIYSICTVITAIVIILLLCAVVLLSLTVVYTAACLLPFIFDYWFLFLLGLVIVSGFVFHKVASKLGTIA